ncbi:unnamed protein product, partial [Schistosoma turkestanicum]
KMKILLLSSVTILTVTTLTFCAVTKTNNDSICKRADSCIFDSGVWVRSRVMSGLVLTGIALLLALVIILTKPLHTTSPVSNIIMIIT